MFRNRIEAARRLAQELDRYRGRKPLVLAVPRGAVPMGRVIADQLEGELDVVLVHKLGAPGNPEYAIGAVNEAGELLLRDSIDVGGVPPAWIERERQREHDVLRRRRALYTPDRPSADPRDRVVIVVDDGIATGATLKAALQAVRAQHPARLVAAVGVAPPESLAELRALADEVVCLETPRFFFAVGQFFERFDQVEDQEVVELLRRPERRDEGA
jgi:putative phosphoribosyl transferase